MTEYYHIVPWFNSAEWHQVYDKIYSPNTSFATLKEALDLLLVWKARCPSLPSGVESTLTLLEVYVQDIRNFDDAVNQQLLRLAYSSSLMRFVNHMLDTETAKGSSLYQAAKNLGVPDWIIDMRHDTAHNNNLPSIQLLREACAISLEWLQKNYWDKQKLSIGDYISGQKDIDSNDENKIAALMNFCISLSICVHSKHKIKNLSDIPDINMRESIINDARDLFGEQLDLSNLKTVSLSSLINLLNSQAKKLLKTKNTSIHVNKVLLGEDSLFLSEELLNYASERDFYKKNKLCKDYIQCFEVLLTFLHSNDLILEFILALINVSQQNNDNNNKAKLAALWVSEILKALKKSKQFINKNQKTQADQVSPKKRKELKLLFGHWFPNERNTGLLLDLEKPIPHELTNIHYTKPIISTYNPNLTYFIKDMVNLLEPHLPKVTADKICSLAKLISSPESFKSVSSKIYTIDDVKSAENASAISLSDQNDSDESCEIIEAPKDRDEHPQNSIWKLASSEHNWAICPIGLLPWQHNTVPMES